MSHVRLRRGGESADATAWTLGKTCLPRRKKAENRPLQGPAQTGSLLPQGWEGLRFRLRRAAYGGDRQMPASVLVVHLQFDAHAGLSLDQQQVRWSGDIRQSESE